MKNKLKITEQIREIPFLSFFSKTKIYYRVKNEKGKVLFSSLNKEDCERYIKNYNCFYNKPRFIIEKNGLGKYRIKSRYNYHRFDNTLWYMEYIPLTEENFDSIEDAELYIKNKSKRITWEKIKEIF